MYQARVTASKFRKSFLKHLFCDSHVCLAKELSSAHFPILCIKETSPTFFAHDCVFVGPNNFKFGGGIHYMVLQAILESCKCVVRGAKTRTSDASWKIANSRLRLIARITSGD